MREAFIDKNFKPASLLIIQQANDIIAEYQAAGYTLTLRQLYYQFVARDLIENSQRSYKRLGSVINDGRMAGYIDWNAIEDRTRNLERNYHADDPADAIDGLLRYYGIDMWSNQPNRVEVWIEKEALIGVIEGVCTELDVPYFACRGYVSQSEQYRAGLRARSFYNRQSQDTVILHFGDHDPSGMDMTRDNDDRLRTFAGYRGAPKVVRVALNMDQIDEYNPPPNPAKVTDSRFEQYRRDYGDESWELDALEPSVIDGLIRQHVDAWRDEAAWAVREEHLAHDIEVLEKIRDDLKEG